MNAKVFTCSLVSLCGGTSLKKRGGSLLSFLLSFNWFEPHDEMLRLGNVLDQKREGAIEPKDSTLATGQVRPDYTALNDFTTLGSNTYTLSLIMGSDKWDPWKSKHHVTYIIR